MINLEGQRFGRLVVIEYSHTDRGVHWKCLCDCGNEHVVHAGNLRRKIGGTKSCGCLVKELFNNRTHGQTDTKLYFVWVGMRNRCNRSNTPHYKNYGNRGISICDKWANSFENFQDWALANGYQEGLEIDRIDNDGDYCPENCRWATRKEQHNNKRNNRSLTFNGKTQNLGQWADELGINRMTLTWRLSKEWSVEEILNKPIRKKKNA